MAKSSPPSKFRVAKRILDIVREARFQPGHHLREHQLSELMGVSRTPVRAALALLEEREIVESVKNRGFFLTASADVLAAAEVEIPSTADQDLYSCLVADRLSGALPETFNQTDISRRYEVDRTLLQKTLLQLANDGLIARKSGRGWSFLPSLDSYNALISSYDFRRTIEPAGILLTTFRVDAAALDKVRMQHLYLESHPDIGSFDPKQLFDADAQFHELIAEFSGNAFFLQAIQQQNRLRRLLEFGGYANRRRVRDWCREHLTILAAIASRERELAATLMADHLESALRNTLANIKR